MLVGKRPSRYPYRKVKVVGGVSAGGGMSVAGASPATPSPRKTTPRTKANARYPRAAGQGSPPRTAAMQATAPTAGQYQSGCIGTYQESTAAAAITVVSNTVLDGVGHQVTISGGNAVRVFQVPTNVAFTLANLVIASGLSTNGGGLYNSGGVVTATNCVFSGNVARQGTTASSAPSLGGAICNAGGQLTDGFEFLGVPKLGFQVQDFGNVRAIAMNHLAGHHREKRPG